MYLEAAISDTVSRFRKNVAIGEKSSCSIRLFGIDEIGIMLTFLRFVQERGLMVIDKDYIIMDDLIKCTSW